jgi:hypothetical protein
MGEIIKEIDQKKQVKEESTGKKKEEENASNRMLNVPKATPESNGGMLSRKDSIIKMSKEMI